MAALRVQGLGWALVMALAGAARGGEADAWRFVQLSDPHCAQATTNPPARHLLHRLDLVHSFDLLEAAVREINAKVKPDFVVVTGDLVNYGRDLASLRRVKAILGRLACPCYPVIGDHDSRASWREVFGAARLNYAFTHRGWRFLAVDCNPGRLDPPTMAWLERALRTQTTTPTILLIHRPLVIPEIYVQAARRLYGVPLLTENAGEVRKLLVKRGNVRAVLAGHCHTAIECTADGMSHCVAPALADVGHAYRIVEIRGTTISTKLRTLGK